MPTFKVGDRQIRFISSDGKRFTKTFHSSAAAARALKGWKAAGGRIAGTGVLGYNSKRGGRKYLQRSKRYS